MSRKGFTLGEILTVLVILGVVAGLAVPMYGSMMESARANEAKASLGVILMGEKKRAISAFKKSLLLEPNLVGAKNLLKETEKMV